MPLSRACDKRKEGTIENQSMLLDLAEMHFERIRKYKDDKMKVADGGKYECVECLRCDSKWR